MGHPLRWFEPGAVYEITTRTIREQFLLTPCPRTRELILGVVGRAQALFPRVDIHYFVFMSNHVHMFLSAEDGESLSYFVGYVNGNVAREIGRFRGMPGPMWGRRMRPIRVVDEASMVARLRYLLLQGCKEGLVATPAEWPGASAYPAFVGNMRMEGTWHHRDEERQARRRGEVPADNAFTETYAITLSPIPAWSRLGPEVLRARHRELVAEVVRETRRINRAAGRTPIGPAAVCAQSPLTTPETVSRSPAPLCHAATPLVREVFRRAYRAFVAAFTSASKALRSGVAAVVFPQGSFPCSGSFVSWPGYGPRGRPPAPAPA